MFPLSFVVSISELGTKRIRTRLSMLLPVILAQAAIADGIHADFHTSAGDFSVLLHSRESPRAVANFIGLAEGTRAWIEPRTGAVVGGKPFYNGLVFHRVIAGFMNQGGCPLGTGTSGPGYKFRDEFAPTLAHDQPYRLSMANSGANTNGSQFFLTVAPTAWLDGVHTIFGTVDAGSAVVDAINAVETDANDKPLEPVVIRSVVIRREGAEALAFDITAQQLPVCHGSRGGLGVEPGVAAVWRMPEPLPGGSIIRGFHSTDLATWSLLGERYQNPGPSEFTELTLDAAEGPRGFYQLSVIDYPDAIGTTAMAGRTLVATLAADESLSFVFDSGGAGGSGTYANADVTTPFTFSVYSSSAAPYSASWVLQTSAYGYLRFRCGLDARDANGVNGRHTAERWNGLGWSSIGSGALRIDG